jgi:hypothetical protein
MPKRDADELDDLDELDLPPPDDDTGDEVEDQADDELPDLRDEGLDDAEADDLDVGGDELETGEEEGDEPEAEVDVGPLDDGLLVDEEAEGAAETDGSLDDDDTIVDEHTSDDDGGAEGTSEDPGDGIDEAALPELDDDDGAAIDDGLADALLAEGDATFTAARWAPLDDTGARLPCRAVAASGGRVAAAGEVLLLIDEGARAARTSALGEGSVAVAVGDDALLAATARGQLLVMRHGSAEASSLGSWRAGLGSSLGLWPAESAASAVELAATPGRFWIRAGAALLCSTSTDQPLAAVRDRGVLAVTASSGVLVALTAGATGPAIARFRNDDEGWAEAALTGEALRVAERDRGAVRIAAAAGGRAVAITDQQRVAVSRDGGVTFVVPALGPVAGIAFAGERPEAPLLVLAAAAKDAAASLMVVTADGAAAALCELPAIGGAAAIAWDAAREVVWVASGAGLVAIGRPQQH